MTTKTEAPWTPAHLVFVTYHSMLSASIVFRAAGLPGGVPPFTITLPETRCWGGPEMIDTLADALVAHVRDGTAAREAAWKQLCEALAERPRAMDSWASEFTKHRRFVFDSSNL